MQPVTNGILITILAFFSHASVAAYGVAIRVEAFAFIVIMALATGMAPVIGQNIGAEQYDRMRLSLRIAMRFAVGWSLFVAVVLALFAAPIAGIFTDDAEIARVIQLYFLIVPVSYVLGNLVPGWASAFNAMGMPGQTVMMLFIKMFVLMIPLGALGAWLNGATGLFCGIATSNILSGAGFHLRNRRLLTTMHEKPFT
jgi:Na+-driven multidrug efflux pump